MNSFFSQLSSFLENEVAPIAHRLDEEEDLFREVYEQLITLGGLNLLIPCALGGLGGGRREWIDYNILMARYSGALLFLQAQHQFSISRLKKLLPEPRVENLLRSLAVQNQGIGLALQKNKNLLRVESVPEGFYLSGTFRWATGFGYFSHLLISFEHNGMLFYALLPFQPGQRECGSLVLSSNIETAVFNAVPSHTITLDRWLVRHEELLASEPVPPKMRLEHPSVYNFAGVSQALLELMRLGQYGTTAEAMIQHNLLTQRWNAYYQSICEGTHDPIFLRVEGLQLAETCSLAARMSCGAASLLKEHPLNRLTREIWQYTIAGYSEEQRAAYWTLFN